MKRVFYLVAATLLILLILDRLFPLTVTIPYSTVIKSREGILLQAFLSQDEKWRMKCNLEDIPEILQRRIIYKEDKYFYYHPGVNPLSVIRAFAGNTFKGYRASGASTISMQVIRLLHPAERTFINKCKEAVNALRLELNYSKKDILSMYLDLLPYGGNIEGVQAASYIYFGKEAMLLSDAQSVTLTIIPNKPTSLKPGANDQLLVSHRNKWLRRFHQAELLSAPLEDALNEPFIMERRSLPVAAPHLSILLASRMRNKPVVKTTISASIQATAQEITWNHHNRISQEHIYNSSVLIVDNRTHEILAWVGNADFNDGEHQGQVNGVNAVRSPGSTLKPLVYGLAIDKGLITPKTVLPDVPVNYDGYAPENFNKDFNGEVTAESALAHSLNIPAVELLEQLGMNNFTASLKKCDFGSIDRHEQDLGLSAVLGGCGVTLKELAGLFSAFANKGEFKRLECIKSSDALPSQRIISTEAAYMITEILSTLQRPDVPNNFQSSYHLPAIAWKTGTSYGRRDAWSVGYNRQYTIGVWCGNFDGTGVPGLTGADIAAPLLFALFNAIDHTGNNQRPAIPAGIDVRYICAATGLPPGDYCAARVMDYYIPGTSSEIKCNHLQPISVNQDETMSYCKSCLEPGAHNKLYAVHRPEVTSYYILKGIPFDRIPEHNPFCQRFINDNIAITSPLNNKQYLLEKGTDEKILLSCMPQPDATFIYWYVNDKLYQKARVHENIFFTPAEGMSKITCADDKGRMQSLTIEAKYF